MLIVDYRQFSNVWNNTANDIDVSATCNEAPIVKIIF